MTPSMKTQVDLQLILPDVHDIADRCIVRLIDLLTGRPGIDRVHITGPENGKANLCVHYDPHVVTIQRLRELIDAAGAQLTATYSHLVVRAALPLHARAARTLEASLRRLPGVFEAHVAASGAVSIEYDRALVSELLLRQKIGSPAARPEAASAAPGKEDMHQPGADVAHEDHAAHGHADLDGAAHAGHDHAGGGPFGEKSELIFALLAGVMLIAGWLSGRSGAGPAWLPIALYVAAYGFGGYFTVMEAIDNLRARRFEIDTLMLVAAVGAAALGKWAEGSLLLFLFSLGHSLEHYAMGRARRAIEALAEIAPETANLRREDALMSVPVAELKRGDIVAVRPNERMPADGVVVTGTTSVNQAPVTGESVPVDKQPSANPSQAVEAFDRAPAENRVFAGTINGSGAVDVMVARAASESTMARVVKMVTDAEAQRSPTQNFTERFERIFVPAVLGLVGLLMFAFLVVDEPFADSFYRAMAVLVAASPCALAISVPSAVLSGIARAARGGVLVKGGAPLENLGTLTSIAFDKTGTLTEGKPILTDALAAEGATEDELLAVALAVEEHSDHPLASAVVAGAKERLGGKAASMAVTDIKSITGRGVQASVDGELVYIGKPVLFSELEGAALPGPLDAANKQLVAEGRTTMIVRKGARFIGVIGVMDTPRPAAAEVMAALRRLGIERLIMISGDNQQVADAVARTVGLTQARGDLMPEQKVAAIKDLAEKHGKVAMVGDGVNDAPAMANATVGIAMGAAGSDVALETADVALMADDLAQLPFAVGLSRRTSRIIKQNLWVSLGVVAVLIPATILGLNIGTAVIFHEGSTLLVVINALRLLAYPDTASPTAAAAPARQQEVDAFGVPNSPKSTIAPS
ncbi:heavy metal translocating P-type ATPase [Massilia sp. H27-R4]|uniref:heavy metal translocating P-type ATPase n=2 Tax=Massilia antarctica TaxID=2765360 RepID=UPI00226F4EE2|nr:heavy metal translocating P-type ATPase [Massilia sp. H27-R4]MCY0910349.1 heavy metal translocating P-type ATPase [Massilia sp. H27-R4]